MEGMLTEGVMVVDPTKGEPWVQEVCIMVAEGQQTGAR